MEADALDDKAAAVLDPANKVETPLQVGRGGELIVDARGENVGLVDTVRQNPDMLTAEASLNRTELCAEAGVLPFALDTAETIQAANSIEKMLAAQLAVLHLLTMKNAATAASFADKAADPYRSASMQQHQIANIEATRSARDGRKSSKAGRSRAHPGGASAVCR